MPPSTVWTLVETVDQIQTLTDKLVGLDGVIPYLYIDIEGNNIGSGGALSLMQLLLFKEKHVYLIDLRLLGEQAFDTAGPKGISLRSVLESPSAAKAFFDVRTDALALHRAYGIELAGVQDIQLMDIAARGSAPRFLGGLAKCIEYSRDIAPAQRRICTAVKAAGHKLFAPEAGGSYAVFDVRPLPDAIKKYCVQDVLLLPTLWNEYQCRLGPDMFDELLREAQRRIEMVQAPGFSRQGRSMAQLPKNWSSFPRNRPRTWVNRATETFKSECAVLREQLSVLALEDTPPKIEASSNATPSEVVSSKALVADFAQLSLQKQASQATAARTQPFGHLASSLLDSSDSRIARGLAKAELGDFWIEDDVDVDADFEDHFPESLGGSLEEDDDMDFTACSAEDCGYCGHCSY